MWRYVCSCWLLAVAAHAQTTDSLARKDFRPTGLRLGTDLIQLGKTMAGSSLQGFELNTDIDFYRYYLALDVGQWQREYQTLDGTYSNNGQYFRLGVDVNFLTKDPEGNMFFMGFRYGRSRFDENLRYTVTDTVFGDYTNERSHVGLTRGWGELVTGLRVKVWKGLWMGYTARFKFAPGSSATPDDWAVYEIPGYGIFEDKSYWGFNYQVFWRIPLRSARGLHPK